MGGMIHTGPAKELALARLFFRLTTVVMHPTAGGRALDIEGKAHGSNLLTVCLF